ncbi:hypothetical protein ONE63_003445 [Megalurothrips usitatus]|uniref:ATPase AAA-type core domain-containing protein n=1 Tax=Megalurothrips usitatus TaxID=439358 RepID=A0AAV7X9P4_9NEOP|nr:hypothetical protein ONE63_003445 [Megalurothrips usitatus]
MTMNGNDLIQQLLQQLQQTYRPIMLPTQLQQTQSPVMLPTQLQQLQLQQQQLQLQQQQQQRQLQMEMLQQQAAADASAAAGAAARAGGGATDSRRGETASLSYCYNLKEEKADKANHWEVRVARTLDPAMVSAVEGSTRSKSTFYCVTSSDLTSKWFGDAKKVVDTSFAVAKTKKSSIIFIDEVDSILSDKNVIVIGATNRPFDVDDAALRRFSKQVYVPLPDVETKLQILRCPCESGEYVKFKVSKKEIEELVQFTDGMSPSDLFNVVREASYMPLHCHTIDELETIDVESLRTITASDLTTCLVKFRPSCDMDRVVA